MSKRRKVWLTLLIFCFCCMTIWITIATTTSFYLLPGVLSVVIIGFDSDPAMKEVMADSIARRFRIQRTIAQEAILPLSLLFAWPLWLVLSIVCLWRDE